ncbi:hypothetical protein Tco_0086818 [Tanacetum coccineum]
MTKGNGTGVRKPTWNNVQRVNKQNQVVTLAVQTRTVINPVNTAKASSTKNFSTARQKVNKQTVLTSTALKVNTVKPIVNDIIQQFFFHKTHSPSSRPFKRTTVLRTNSSNQKVYTVKVKEVSTVGGKWDTAVKSSAVDVQAHDGNKLTLLTFRLMGPVAFGGSKGYPPKIYGKGENKKMVSDQCQEIKNLEGKDQKAQEAGKTLSSNHFKAYRRLSPCSKTLKDRAPPKKQSTLVSTDGSKVSTDEQIEGADDQVEGTKENNEGTKEIFESTEVQREGTEEKAERKGKKKIEEEDESKSEDDDIPQAVKKFKQLESDEVMARQIQEEWEAEEEASPQLEERAKFLHDTIAAQRKFLAQQRSEAIRNKPPTKNQLRNKMMTYLKHVGNFKHSELKSKKFEDIQQYSSKREEIKQESEQEVKEEDKEEENTRKRKLGTRKKIKSRKRRFKQDTSQDDPSDTEKENHGMEYSQLEAAKFLQGRYTTLRWTDKGLVIHMLIEKKYPLKKEILVQMLKLKLESEEESTMALELIRFIKKSWLVQDQTVLGKDYSNLLIADSLLKTIWFINAPCYDNEALASPNTNDEELSIPEQTATGKGTSNPLMAGSLPKTTKPT